MPSELFSDVRQRPASVRSRNRAIVFGSISVHAVVLIGALFFSLSSPGPLPIPRAVLAFVDPSPDVTMVDIELPIPAPSRPVTADASDALRDVVPAQPTTGVDAAGITPAPRDRPASSPDTSTESSARTANRAAVNRIESGGVAGDGLGFGRIERPAAPIVAQTPVRLHSGIHEPVKTMHVDPAYPAIAQQARVQGVVILEAVIGVTGRVESVQVLRSIPLLDQAAVSAVRQWQYRPATLNDTPIPVIVTVTVNFKL